MSDGASRRPASSAPAATVARPSRPARVRTLLAEAIAGERRTSLLGSWGPAAAWSITAVYVVGALVFPDLDVATSFAIVPLVFAALALSARSGVAVAAVTAVTVVAVHALRPTHPLTILEGVELAAFAAASLALRLVVVRLERGREEIDRARVALASMQAQVAEARDVTERWVAQLDVAQRAAARMAGRASVRAVAEVVTDEIRAIVDYHACRVYLLDGDALVPVVAAGDNGYETISLDDLALHVGEGFAGWVAANGRPLLVPDANADPRGATIPGTDEIDESMVVVPMRYDELVTGVIALSKLGLRQFDLADVRILATLADQAATAIESARAMGASRALAEDLRRITAMSSALSRSLDPRTVADLTAEHLGSALSADECEISFWDRQGDRLLTWGLWPSRGLAAGEPSFALAGYPETRRVLEAQAVATIDTEDPGADRAEVELLRQAGRRSLVMLPLIAKGETIGLVELRGTGPFRIDASRVDFAHAMANEAAMALANARLYDTARALADRDPLTGFFNHRYLHERLGEEILRAQRAKAPLAVLMIDLDEFKLVNDTLGHLFGDDVLRWTAEQIRAELRGSDVPARYGGDEFAVILPDTSAEGAREVGRRIVAALEERPYRAEGRGAVPVGASIGVAAFPGDGQTATTLIAGADAALYRVKRRGGGGVDGRIRRRLGSTAASA